MPKRKSVAVAVPPVTSNGAQSSTVARKDTVDTSAGDATKPATKRRAKARREAQPELDSVDPNHNAEVLDGPQALRASPDADEQDERMDVEKAGMDAQMQIKKEGQENGFESGTTSISSKASASKARVEAQRGKSESKTTAGTKVKSETKGASESQFLDPEAEGDEEADEEEIQAALSRPPPVNSDYLPLPWKGRLGYACLNTYLRFSNPPVFSSRTCRIASILENRHPLTNPDEPAHATKNRPDKDKPPDVARGQAFVESLGKANAKDIVKMLKWNEKFGIKFLRLSSEMFPFASHEEYGYKLAPFVSEELAEAGRYAAEHGHRLTTHPGQYTQLGSPRKSVIDGAFRDLDYHAELLELLKMPPQEDRDAVMILHLGGVFGDKEATLNRFRENYAKLPEKVKKRLVLENDDVSWSVHELLPLCEELNIPMVLDFHHHNIIFDSTQCREGTKDIIDLFPRILATWSRKGITPKMHYSEPTPAAITGRQRRKHSPRVASLPPCPPTMDLMIEAKDKEQAVFELMRNFRLPGHTLFTDMLPHIRKDDNKQVKPPSNKKAQGARKRAKTPTTTTTTDEDGDEATIDSTEGTAVKEQPVIPDEEVGMGGPEGRVYWPPGMEEWLRPVKKVVKPREPKKEKDTPGSTKKMTPAQKKKLAAEEAAIKGAEVEEEVAADEGNVPINDDPTSPTPTGRRKKTVTSSKSPTLPSKVNGVKKGKKRAVKKEMAVSDDEDDDSEDLTELESETGMEDEGKPKRKRAKTTNTDKRRGSGRTKKSVDYTETYDD